MSAPDDKNAFPHTCAKKRRWPVLLATGLLLCGGAGWALAGWGEALQTADAYSQGMNETEVGGGGADSLASASMTSAIRKLSAERQLELAFAAVFGDGKREIHVGEDEALSFAKGKLVWTEFGPVLIAEGNGDSYPSAIGTLGIFYLREVPGPAFEEVRRWPDAVPGSIMGNPPRWTVRHDIANGPVVESTSGGVWQGYACHSTTLTELADSGPVSLITFNSGYDSTGAQGESGERYEGTIANAIRNRSFDVGYTGTNSIIEHYVRNGAEFLRVPASNEEMNESLIPTC
ncbi:hypothetical protein [Altererythrobacter sp. Z27]|uniref:hypothetical protein n=1 Tax=Altererythrobacter sp. Z27 TaxID=3461147 RepID=UPI004044DA2C